MDFRGNFPEGPAHWSVWLEKKWESWTRRNRDTKNFVRGVNVWWQLARNIAGIPRSLIFQGKLTQTLTVPHQPCLVLGIAGVLHISKPCFNISLIILTAEAIPMILTSVSKKHQPQSGVNLGNPWSVEAVHLICLKIPKKQNQLSANPFDQESEERHTLTF